MVVSSGTATVTLPTDEQILITREFDAPKDLVYKAWTTPELVKRWWSGHQGEMTIAEIDLRVGGTWRYVMVSGDGHEVAFHGKYREIVPNERIVTTEVFEMPGSEPPGDADVPLNIVTFTEVEGHTILTLLVQCPNKELRDAIVDSGMEVGMQEQMDLLEQLVISLR
ncbi:MAG: SRPBCC family protein [Actinomycetota bacterium]